MKITKKLVINKLDEMIKGRVSMIIAGCECRMNNLVKRSCGCVQKLFWPFSSMLISFFFFLLLTDTTHA